MQTNLLEQVSWLERKLEVLDDKKHNEEPYKKWFLKKIRYVVEEKSSLF